MQYVQLLAAKSNLSPATAQCRGKVLHCVEPKMARTYKGDAQERCEKHEARESALAREEAQARELVRELRALAVEAREARKGLASSPFDLARLAGGNAGTDAGGLASAYRAARAADDAMGDGRGVRAGWRIRGGAGGGAGAGERVAEAFGCESGG